MVLRASRQQEVASRTVGQLMTGWTDKIIPTHQYYCILSPRKLNQIPVSHPTVTPHPTSHVPHLIAGYDALDPENDHNTHQYYRSILELKPATNDTKYS
jgi:hypothetical protein